MTPSAASSIPADARPASLPAKAEREHEDRSRATGLTVVSGVPNKRLSIIVLVKNSAFQRRRAEQQPEQQSDLQPGLRLPGRRRTGAAKTPLQEGPNTHLAISSPFPRIFGAR